MRACLGKAFDGRTAWRFCAGKSGTNRKFEKTSICPVHVNIKKTLKEKRSTQLQGKKEKPEVPVESTIRRRRNTRTRREAQTTNISPRPQRGQGRLPRSGERDRRGDERKVGGEGKHKSEEEPVDRPAGETNGGATNPGEETASVAVITAVEST